MANGIFGLLDDDDDLPAVGGGLLGDPLAAGLLGLGAGLLSASGPSTTPISTGEALASGLRGALSFSQQAVRNQLVRQRIEDEARQRRARQALVQRATELAPRVPVSPRAPQGVAGLMDITTQPDPTLGLLAEVAPEAFAKQLIEARFATQEAPEFASPLGKLFQDRELAERTGNTAAVEAIDEVIRGQLGSEVDLTKVRQFRNDVISNSESFIQARAAFDRVQAGATAESPAGDLALVFGFMKMLDPGSVVREGEFATAQNTAGVPERIRGMYNRLLTGERLTPSQRADFVNQARSQLESAVERQRRLVDDFSSFAERQGFAVQDVVPGFVVPGQRGQTLTESERDELNRLRREMNVAQ